MTRLFGSKSSTALVVACLLVAAGCRETLAPEKSAAPKPQPHLTTAILSLAPADTTVAIAIPSLDRLRTKITALITRVSPEEKDLADRIDKAFVDLAADLGLKSGETMVEFFHAIGVDASAPIGLFFATQTPSEEGDSPSPEAGEQPAEIEEEPSPPESESEEGESRHEFWTKDHDEQFAVVLTYTDAKAAEESLATLLKKLPDWDTFTLETREAEGVTLNSYTPDICSYFFTDTHMVVSNSEAFALEVAKRSHAPVASAYGDRVATNNDDEVVALIRMDHIAGPMAEAAGEADEDNSSVESFIRTFMRQLGTGFADDPLILTLNWGDEAIELLGRLDLERHEGPRKILGKASPLRLAAYAPKEARAVFAVRFNEDNKKLFLDAISALMEGETAQFQQLVMALNILKQWTELVDDEIVLSVSGATEKYPKGLAMMAVDDVTQLGRLMMLLPGKTLETYEGVEIKETDLALPVQLYYGVGKNTLVLGTDLEELKAVFHGLVNEEKSGLFETFTPPIDPATPRYLALFLKSELLEDVIAPMSQGKGAPDPERDKRNGRLQEIIQDARLTIDLNQTWLEGRLRVQLNPPAPSH